MSFVYHAWATYYKVIACIDKSTVKTLKFHVQKPIMIFTVTASFRQFGNIHSFKVINSAITSSCPNIVTKSVNYGNVVVVSIHPA